MLATFDGLLLAGATLLGAVFAAAVTVGVPVLVSNRRTRARLGTPNGGGSVAGDVKVMHDSLTAFREDQAEFRGTVLERIDGLRHETQRASASAEVAKGIAEQSATEVRDLAVKVSTLSADVQLALGAPGRKDDA